MTRIFYDSADASAIPADAVGVCGYDDGETAWSAADWARFPNAVQAHIVVNPATNSGSILDVEKGNWPSADAVPWIVMRRASGVVPTVYGNNGVAGYRLTEVTAACMAQGVAPPQYWFASWGSPAVLPDGYVALQYANGPDYDTNIVADVWPGVDPAPAPDPAPIDPGSALNDINAGLALMDQARQLFVNAGQDITPANGGSAVLPPPPPVPQPATDLTARFDVLVTSVAALSARVQTLEQETDPVPAPSRPAVSLTWLPLALSVVLIVVQQALVTLRAVPPSTPVTVTILILTILAASIPAIEALLNAQTAARERMQARQQAHELALAAKDQMPFTLPPSFTASPVHQAVGLA
jgi:hypothetical protein